MTTPNYPPPSTNATNPAQQWLLTGLQMLRDDLRTAQVINDPATRVTAAARAVGLDHLSDDVLDILDRAIAEMEPLKGMFAGPVAPEVRMLAVSGALAVAAEAHRLIPTELARAEGRAELVGLAEALARVVGTAGTGFRHRAVEKLRGLYVIIDPELTNGRDSVWVAEQAIAGGAKALQLRDKARDKGKALPLAQLLASICHSADVTLVINDHPDIAMAVDAHGVHLGQHDLPLRAARRVLWPWQVAGTSNALVNEADTSYQQGADYIAIGRMFETNSKSDTRPAGPETLREVREQVPPDGPPLIAIGGITTANVGELAAAGADGVCVVSAVTQADNPRGAAEALLDAFWSAH